MELYVRDEFLKNNFKVIVVLLRVKIRHFYVNLKKYAVQKMLTILKLDFSRLC
jgi:hypothetical protein